MLVATGTIKCGNGRPCRSEPFVSAQDKLHDESHAWPEQTLRFLAAFGWCRNDTEGPEPVGVTIFEGMLRIPVHWAG